MNLVAIHAHNPGPMTGAGNWTWLLKGRVTTLIDAGTGEAGHLAAVAAALDGRPLDQVVVTHGHVDHASGVMALQARFAGVRFVKYPWPGRDATWPVDWDTLADGEVIQAGDTALEIVHTPGHAPDHCCLWHQPSCDLFCADLAMESGSIYIPSKARGGDLRAYLSSLQRVLDLQPKRLLPAHGGIIEDPATLLRGFITHRQDREQQVRAALRDGLTTPDEILDRIYPGIRPPMVPFARDTIVAQLEKIERDRIEP